MEETIREVRRCIRLRIASAWETGSRQRNPLGVESGYVPVSWLIEERAVLGLEERYGQIGYVAGYVALAGVFGKVVEVC